MIDKCSDIFKRVGDMESMCGVEKGDVGVACDDGGIAEDSEVEVIL